MAKKAVAGFRDKTTTSGRSHSKVIKMVKSETGSYSFQEEMILNELVQDYFKNEENRDPSETELRVLDTYWSDHCRHTTFETVLDSVDFKLDTLKEQLQESYNRYLELREKVHGNKK